MRSKGSLDVRNSLGVNSGYNCKTLDNLAHTIQGTYHLSANEGRWPASSRALSHLLATFVMSARKSHRSICHLSRFGDQAYMNFTRKSKMAHCEIAEAKASEINGAQYPIIPICILCLWRLSEIFMS
ncbi:hypothetical protein PsorP6_008052 [Peronosclerospora sorghi]|uniref:Uncharacterized protein n=1 Tax=Peronosclerospora sorghi TaxID=230839 RepID=A0ACC0W7X7_9STRA|nr:hypothetical protein PsorP6_008052 [Peronosclerospora sorghi]